MARNNNANNNLSNNTAKKKENTNEKNKQEENNGITNGIENYIGLNKELNSEKVEKAAMEKINEESKSSDNSIPNNLAVDEGNSNMPTENLNLEKRDQANKGVDNGIENTSEDTEETNKKNREDKNSEITLAEKKNVESKKFTIASDSVNNPNGIITQNTTTEESIVKANENVLKEESKDSISTKETAKDSTAQESKEEKEKKEKQHAMVPFSIDVFLAPSRNYRSVSGDNTVISEKDNYERVKSTLGAGVRLNYSFNEKWYASMGVQYSHFGEKYKYHKEQSLSTTKYSGHWQEDSVGGVPTQVFVIDDTIVTVTKEVKSEKKNNYYKYISVPLSVTYSFGKGKLRYALTAGISMNFLTNAYSYRISDGSQNGITESTSGDKNPFRRMTTSIVICPAITYSFSERWKLLVEPGFNIFMNSVYAKDYAYSHKPYSFNIKAGLRYVLK